MSQLPRWRKMTWAIVIWCALIVVWTIAGANAAECEKEGDLQDACEAGTGIGVAIVLAIGFFGFVALSLIWLMTRPRVDSARSGVQPTPAQHQEQT